MKILVKKIGTMPPNQMSCFYLVLVFFNSFPCAILKSSAEKSGSSYSNCQRVNEIFGWERLVDAYDALYRKLEQRRNT